MEGLNAALAKEDPVGLQASWYASCTLARHMNINRGKDLILDDTTTSVAAQLGDQAKPGVQISAHEEVPETGPTNRGVWWRIGNVTAVFADLRRSTDLSSSEEPRVAAIAYTYFIRAMAVILDRFSARYIDIQGDGIFGLFSGKDSAFMGAAAAITMKTEMERTVAVRFNKDASTDRELKAGVGIDQGTLLVRRLGLRGTKQNEVWAGRPVSVAAKLSSLADDNQLVVSDRVFDEYERASRLRQRALVWSCGCSDGIQGAGLDVAIGGTSCLWEKEAVPRHLGLDFESVYKLESLWCRTHGAEFCEAIVSGKRPAR